MLIFSVNVCALGIKTVKTVSADKIIVGGGDGQVVLFNINGKDTT